MRLRTLGLIVPLAFSLAAPLAAGAQPAGKVYRIGILSVANQPQGPAMEAFRRGLQERGYVEGFNFTIEYRAVGDAPERYPELVAALVQLNVDVIVALSTPSAIAAKRGTSTVPIVMVWVTDPVGSGLVQSLARPGGNVTGLSLAATETSVKYLQLLKEAKPTIKRVIGIIDPTNPGQIRARTDAAVQAAAKALALSRELVTVTTGEDLVAALPAIVRARADAITVAPLDHVARSDIQKLVDFTIKQRLPSITNRMDYVEQGLLLLFSTNLGDQIRYAATHVDKILKGARPADLPVEQPTRFDLVINLKTARVLGLTIPPSLLLRADRVIE